jgi:hypothetical protein
MQNFPITKLHNQESTHGKYSNSQQRRTQEGKTHRAEKAQNRAPVEAPRVRARVAEAESEEDGARRI